MPENKHYLYLKMNDVAHAVVAAFSIFSLKFPSNVSNCFRIQSTTKISQLIQHVKSICIDHYRTCDKRMSPLDFNRLIYFLVYPRGLKQSNATQPAKVPNSSSSDLSELSLNLLLHSLDIFSRFNFSSNTKTCSRIIVKVMLNLVRVRCGQ